MNDLTMDVRGTRVPVRVETEGSYEGYFIAVLDGEVYRSHTWYDLHSQLMEASARAAIEVDVPFTAILGPEVRTGKVRAVHASRHGVLLVTWDHNGQKGQIERPLRWDLLGPLDEGTMAEVKSLAVRRDVINARLQAIRDEHGINLVGAVEEEVAARVKAMTE